MIGLITLSLLMGLGIGFVRLATTLYALQLDAHGWMLAAVAFTQSVGMLALGFVASDWVSRYGVRIVFVLATLWGGLIYVLTPLVPSLWALLAFSAAASLAMPLRFVAINTIFMSRLKEIGQHRAGWFRAAHVIGMTFLGAVAASTLFPMLGALAVFWIAAGISLVNLLAFAFFARSIPAGAHGETSPLAAPMFSDPLARKVAFQEFTIQSLNAYYAFYIVVIVVRYLQLSPSVAGLAVAVQGTVFVLTLVGAGAMVLKHPQASPVLGVTLVIGAVLLLVAARQEAMLFCAAAILGVGLGLLQIINLTQFASLGARIGYSRAAAINALSGPGGGVVGGALGGLLEAWLSPQTAFCVFIPLFLVLALWRNTHHA